MGAHETGDDSTDDAGVVTPESSMNVREIDVKSESLPDMMEEFEEADEEIELAVRSLMLGAFKAFTFVVESSSVGSEMRLRLIVPVANLTLPSRVGVFSLLNPRLVRLVRARARDAIMVSSIVNVVAAVEVEEKDFESKSCAPGERVVY